MAKRKYKLHHLHKIKVHHNRWLIWALAYALIIAIALVGYIKVSDSNLQTELTAEADFKSWRMYNDQRLGFALRYPSDWSIEVGVDSTINFSPGSSEDVGVEVYRTTTASENAIRRSLDIVTEEEITVNNEPAVRILSDLGGKHLEEVVLIKHNKKLYVVRGTKNLVDRLMQTFYFTQ